MDKSLKNPKKNLYIIGGISNAGKTTVAAKLAQEHGLYLIKTDVVRLITRNAITGKHPDKHIGRVSFTGSATFQAANDPKIKGTLAIERTDQGEDDLAWLGVLGIINHFDGRPESAPDILIEGVAAKPQYVYELTPQLKHYAVKSIFIGYTEGKPKTTESEFVRKEAERFALNYFDRKGMSIEEQFDIVKNFFLNN